MKIGSTGARISLVTSNEEAIDILAQAKLDTIDFWLYLCSLDNNYPLYQDDWKEWVAQIRQRLEDTHLTVYQSHALFNIFIPQNMTYIPPQEIMFRNMHACKMLGCSKLVFHPVAYLQRVKDREHHQQILEYNLRWFRELLPLAEKLELELHVENLFDFAGAQQPGDISFAFTTMEDICWLVDTMDHPLFKTCFDTGHANISGVNPADGIHQLGKRLGSVHLQDNFGRISPIEPDVHLFPGHGQIDWAQVLLALKDVGFNGVLNMEPVGALPRLPKELMVHQFSEAAGFLRKMARHCDWPEG